MLSFFCAAILVASEFTFAADPKAVPADKYEGKVLEVKEGKVTIMNSKGGDNLVFVVNSSTVITRNGKPAALKEIMPEDKAEITATGEGKEMLAKTLSTVAAK